MQNRSLRTEKTGEIPPFASFVPAAIPTNIDDFLPQQADDNTVRQKVLTVFDQIGNHVDNYYGDRAEKLTAAQESDISRYDSPSLGVPLAALLEKSHRKLPIIKHCLGVYTVKLVSSPAGVDSLLPSEATAVLALPEAHNQRTSGDSNYSLALSRWRMLTAYIRPDLFDGSSLQEVSYDSRIYELAARFSRAFGPFSKPQYDDRQRTKHLTEVFRSAARLVLWLRSQPSTFKFDWGPTGSERSASAVTTVPALMKTHDGEGAALNPPLAMY